MNTIGYELFMVLIHWFLMENWVNLLTNGPSIWRRLEKWLTVENMQRTSSHALVVLVMMMLASKQLKIGKFLFSKSRKFMWKNILDVGQNSNKYPSALFQGTLRLRNTTLKMLKTIWNTLMLVISLKLFGKEQQKWESERHLPMEPAMLLENMMLVITFPLKLKHSRMM